MGMPRACSVRQCLAGAAAHLYSSAVSLYGSRLEDLPSLVTMVHSAAPRIAQCWADRVGLDLPHSRDGGESARAQHRESVNGARHAQRVTCGRGEGAAREARSTQTCRDAKIIDRPSRS